ncbi:conserved hypothetical protein [Ricinus communis]|uniref:Uncharacterized protein n=1 Tax=Ricinus communis TaxID=3988 RepID=B9T5M2_RICCO|nr:conserved hypothetical protein [Ricinus communis]
MNKGKCKHKKEKASVITPMNQVNSGKNRKGYPCLVLKEIFYKLKIDKHFAFATRIQSKKPCILGCPLSWTPMV